MGLIPGFKIPVNSYRCFICETHWPPVSQYLVCPKCQESTESNEQPPIGDATAARARLYGDFGWWLWDNDRL